MLTGEHVQAHKEWGLPANHHKFVIQTVGGACASQLVNEFVQPPNEKTSCPGGRDKIVSPQALQDAGPVGAARKS